MRVQITHLKAPWPVGAKVGDVLELPAVPAWALGKCRQVGGDVAVTDIEQRRLSQAIATFDIGLDAAKHSAILGEGGGDTVTEDGSGAALPPIDPLPVINEPKPKAKK